MFAALHHNDYMAGIRLRVVAGRTAHRRLTGAARRVLERQSTRRNGRQHRRHQRIVIGNRHVYATELFRGGGCCVSCIQSFHHSQ